MTKKSGEINLAGIIVGLVLGATSMAAYVWFMTPNRSAELTPDLQQTVKERASDINNRAQLEAANHELDATNLSEIDSELTRIQVEAAF